MTVRRPSVMKEAAEDCVITTDSGKTLPVPKGTNIGAHDHCNAPQSYVRTLFDAIAIE
jgi:hypothetical protein